MSTGQQHHAEAAAKSLQECREHLAALGITDTEATFTPGRTIADALADIEEAIKAALFSQAAGEG